MRTRGQVLTMENFYNLLDIARQNPPPIGHKHFPISCNYFRHAGPSGVFGRKQFSYKIFYRASTINLRRGDAPKDGKNEVVRR